MSVLGSRGRCTWQVPRISHICVGLKDDEECHVNSADDWNQQAALGLSKTVLKSSLTVHIVMHCSGSSTTVPSERLRFSRASPNTSAALTPPADCCSAVVMSVVQVGCTPASLCHV
jgi:hypothetical protein